MANIDGEFIRAANDRLQWDGIWEDSVPRVTRGDGDDVHATLDRAIIALFQHTGGGKPQLILCSWATARELLLEAGEREPEGHFPTDADYRREADKRAFQYDSGAMRLLFERGYLGTYGGAVVIASVYLGVWESDYAIVASVRAPGEVQYDGSNCVLVDMGCEE